MKIKWTDERVKKLKTLWQAGYTGSEISQALDVTRSAVLGKLHRLNLKKKIGKRTTGKSL